MKKQCNLCGLREDLPDLVSKNKTWCLVYDKEVDNKFQNCAHWRPDGSSIRAQKVQIANDIKRSIKPKTEQKKEGIDSKMEITLSSKKIWEEIQKDYGITKRAFGMKFNFVTDQFKRRIIFRDVEHAYILANNGLSKPSVVLAGGVIEELLRLYLNYKGIKPDKQTFDSYIQACEKNGLLKSGINRLSDSVRHFRNIVHLEKEKSSQTTIKKVTAKGAVTSIFTIANDF
jgi:hypothetical protein